MAGSGIQAPAGFLLPKTSPFTTYQYGGDMPNYGSDPTTARLQALQSVGQNYSSGGGGIGGGALGGAGTGAALGTMIAPGIGTVIGAGLGGLVGAVGAGIEGTKEDKSKKEQAANERRKLDLIEREMKNAQLNAERSGGMEGLKYLAGIQSNAIQSRNRSLFKNDLMRVVGQGV